MTWLGLEYDEGPFYQTKRFDRYNEVIDELLVKSLAYRCNCSRERLETLREGQMTRKEKPRYDGHCRGVSIDATEPHVIRFCNPREGAVVVDDQVRGKIVFSNDELDDLIIRRSDGSPTYNLTVVVDDLDMGITDVIRGDDHVNNTPRQINILKALGKEPPRYAHVPMILGDDGSRLSKRHGAVSVMEYRNQGILPEALLNYLVRLGWSYGDEELFTLDQMVELFAIEDVNKSASAFSTEKLLWINQHHIKQSEPARIARLLSPLMGELGIDPAEGPDLVEVVRQQQERAKTLVEMAEISAFFYRDFDDYEPKAAKKHLKAAALDPLQQVRDRLAALDDWAGEKLHQVVTDVSEALSLNMGKVAQPLRVAIAGRAASPGIDVTLELVGREACLRRIDKALAYINHRVDEQGS
jgi:glutamyl-tRNA synthetase